MVEREGLEPDGRVSQINKLRITLKIRTPDFPSNTRIWHSIWHWTNSNLVRNVGSESRRKPLSISIATARSTDRRQRCNRKHTLNIAICNALRQSATRAFTLTDRSRSTEAVLGSFVSEIRKAARLGSHNAHQAALSALPKKLADRIGA